MKLEKQGKVSPNLGPGLRLSWLADNLRKRYGCYYKVPFAVSTMPKSSKENDCSVSNASDPVNLKNFRDKFRQRLGEVMIRSNCVGKPLGN